jgi:hypothetical protein
LMAEVGLHRRRPCAGALPDVRLHLVRLRPLAHRRRPREVVSMVRVVVRRLGRGPVAELREDVIDVEAVPHIAPSQPVVWAAVSWG